MSLPELVSHDHPPTPQLQSWRNPATVQVVASAVIIVAGGWWMLGQLAVVLRPLLIAVFLCYVLLPSYSWLRRKAVPAAVAIVLLAGSVMVGLIFLSLFVYGNLLGLVDEAPKLKEQALTLVHNAHEFIGENTPSWWGNREAKSKRPEEFLAEQMPIVLQTCVQIALGGILEAAVAGLYLLFLLVGVEKLPTRVRQAYPKERAEQLLHVGGRINSAIISYLKAKVLSSLVFAIPVWLVLTLFGVKFAVLWAVLTFVCNFIPYIGSAIAYTVPVAFAMLQFGGSAHAFGTAVALLVIHVVCATLLEPMLIGRAVGLSPLVVLAALAVWGSVWGLPGMVLAVPLTVVMKIVMENIEATRSMAKLIEE